MTSRKNLYLKEQELPTHRSHCAAVGMTINCDADWWSLVRLQALNNL
jgi:hypothetical protein